MFGYVYGGTNKVQAFCKQRYIYIAGILPQLKCPRFLFVIAVAIHMSIVFANLLIGLAIGDIKIKGNVIAEKDNCLVQEMSESLRSKAHSDIHRSPSKLTAYTMTMLMNRMWWVCYRSEKL